MTKSDKNILIEQVKAKGIKSKPVLKAMGSVDRADFVPPEQKSRAYADGPLPIGSGQTISQPYIVACMTERLELNPGDRVLEVGTGSGYQLAILAQVTSEVYGIEKLEELIEMARKNFERAGLSLPPVKHGDGYEGWPEKGPFDGIIVTAAAVHIPPPLIQQLAPGGRMVLPVGAAHEIQRLVRVVKDQKGATATEQLEPVRFVPMVGRAQERG